MGKIPTRAEFLKAVKAAGYDGADELDGIEKWAETKGFRDFEDSGGNTFTAKQAWDNVPKQALKLKHDAGDEDDSVRKAQEVKVAAIVEERLKRMGLGEKPDRATQPKPEPVKVKSSQQRVWEMYQRAGLKGHNAFSDYETAEAFHNWVRANYASSPNAHLSTAYGGKLGEIRENATKAFRDFAETKAMSTPSLTGGSALVPEVFVPDLTKNVLDYGVARRLAKVTMMPAPELMFPRRTGGMTVYYPAENNAPTQSNPTYDNYRLSSKTGVVLCQVSMQLMEDSGIGLAAELADEIARAVALQEDTMLLTGNGSSTHAGVTGFTSLYGTTATDGGYVYSGGNDTTLTLTAAMLNAAMGRLPQYARANATWTCNAALAPVIFDRLAIATPGGLTWREFEGLGYVRVFLGRPVIENNVMGSTTDASGDRIDILYGDFQRAARFGDHMGLQIDFNDSRYWDAVSIGVRGVVRHAITVHDVGSASAAGPVISIWQT